MTDETTRFRAGLLLLVALALAAYSPILAGYVPFPADLVVQFPPWEGTASRACCAGFQHAELGDLVTQFYPWRAFLNSTLSIGRAPLWNFHVLMGTPFQAMPQSGVFFPLNWLFSLLSAPFAWSLLFVVRTAITAVTTALFVKRLGTSSMAAIISGLAFAFCGWVTAFQGRPQLDTAMWLPLLFLSVEWLRSKPSPASVSLAAVAFALPVLGGHPEIAFQMISLGLAYAVYRAFPFTPASGRYLAAFGMAGVLSMMLAAVQILPTLEWIGLIKRSLSERWPPMPSAQSITFFSRHFFHNPNVDGVFIPEVAGYIGAFTAAVVPFAWFWRKRRDALYFASLAFVCIEIAYGWQPMHWIVRHVPVLAGLPNWRFLVGADFAFAVLAGLAVSALESRSAETKPVSQWPALLVTHLATALAVTLILLRVFEDTAIPYRVDLVLVVCGVVIAALAATRRIPAAAFLQCAVVLVAADLLTFAFGYIPFVKPADIYPRNPTFDFLAQHANSTWRIGAVEIYGSNFEIPYGFATAAGYDFPTRRIARFLATFNATLQNITWNSARLVNAPKGALDFTGTRYFVATTWNTGAASLAALPNRFRKVFENGTTQVFENPDAIPLVSFLPASAIQVVVDDDAQLKGVLAADFDPRRAVIVPEKVEAFSGVRGAVPNPRPADTVSQGIDELTAGIAADQDGVAVLSETAYPGWTVEVDGQPASLIRANYAFMAVPVTQGRHNLRFRFAPATVRWGGALSALGLLLVAGALVTTLRK